jgi:hypothetical protein
MKNVNGLYNAMRLVESACDKGEITIIGEGATPSPIELYNKCVAYINSRYGVDILNLVAQTSMRKDCGDCCCDCCCNDEEEEHYINVNMPKVKVVVEEYLSAKTPWLSPDTLTDIVNDIESYYNNQVDEAEEEDYNIENCAEHIIDIINDNLDTCCIDEDYINDLADTLAGILDCDCVSID